MACADQVAGNKGFLVTKRLVDFFLFVHSERSILERFPSGIQNLALFSAFSGQPICPTFRSACICFSMQFAASCGGLTFLSSNESH